VYRSGSAKNEHLGRRGASWRASTESISRTAGGSLKYESAADWTWQATEERGENARLSSFVGAMALGDLVKSTLGPKVRLLHPIVGGNQRFTSA